MRFGDAFRSWITTEAAGAESHPSLPRYPLRGGGEETGETLRDRSFPVAKPRPAVSVVAGLLGALVWSSGFLNVGAVSGAEPPVGRVVTNSIGMKLAYIPAGKFTMGSPLTEAERELDEVPHEVEITQPFYMGVHEVTQEQFAQIIGARPQPVFDSSNGGGPQHPMESVVWEEASQFCERLSQRTEEQRAGRQYRLPSEAEWEYACRAGTETAFYFGESLSSDQATFDGRVPYGDVKEGAYLRRTTPVGSYAPNAFGLYDMHGNVWELCADFYDPNYYRDSPTEDPLGPPLGVVSTGYGSFYRVIRGGSWLDDARACRSAYRYRVVPQNHYPLIGFRVVCDLTAVDASAQE